MTHALFRGAFAGRRVLVTGDTGFKGGWLAQWLLELGAEVSGLALEPDTQPSLYDELGLSRHIDHIMGDIRDAAIVKSVMHRIRPEAVLHLAAQPLVRRSYAEPILTFETNVMGTANVLEAARGLDSVGAVVVVTTDKVYRNNDTGAAFSEDDPLGGYDPYSASKACTEIVAQSYQQSFLDAARIPMATARAGNVIGGGDWALDRIVPDCVRALGLAEPIGVRNPSSLRPWQHVLEPLSGYLWLVALMLEGDSRAVDAFNFGPDPESARTVGELVNRLVAGWGSGSWMQPEQVAQPHEAALLRLDISRVADRVGWRPVWAFETAVDRTVEWYRRHHLAEMSARELVAADIAAYVLDAASQGSPWSSAG
ncbi:MAG: CDP-glucose 4,6-dehydratase [Actinobacteria bacterium HGW-Actinobacteria-6]|nr:MAG: CDP-glucose 4,6-dehydratase [Actinobacteria bacterium HGW-Actinobacteria-6]